MSMQLSRGSLEQEPARETVGKAMDKAMRLLGLRSRSRHEMAQRLQSAGFDEPTVAAVDDRLCELGLLDDASFAREVCRSRSRAGWSSKRIAQDLRTRGVDNDLVEDGLAEMQQEGTSDEDRALQLALAKARSCRSIPPEKALHRVVRHLYGKGYESEVAWDAARSAFRALDEGR